MRLLRRWQEVQANEVRFKEYFMEDARFAGGRVWLGRAGGAFRGARRAPRRHPGWAAAADFSLRPFPSAEIARLCERTEGFLVVEMNTGQMLEDVRLAVGGRRPVEFYGRLGGVMPFPDEILAEIRRMAAGDIEPGRTPARPLAAADERVELSQYEVQNAWLTMTA